MHLREGHLPQPEHQVRFRLDLAQALEQLQNVLRQIFSQRAVAEEMQRNAENHALVLAHEPGKGSLVACCRPRQPVVRRFQFHRLRLPHGALLPKYGSGLGECAKKRRGKARGRYGAPASTLTDTRQGASPAARSSFRLVPAG